MRALVQDNVRNHALSLPQYRSQRFSRGDAQDHVTRTLINAFATVGCRRYLFCGPRGTGKTSPPHPGQSEQLPERLGC